MDHALIQVEPTPASRRFGFTLFELVVVIAVGGVLAAWTAHTVQLATEVSQRATATLHGVDRLNDTMSWIERDVAGARHLSLGKSEGHSAHLQLEDGAGKKVNYVWAGGTLRRNGAALATDVGMWRIEALDRHGHLTHEDEAVVSLLVSLEIEGAGGPFDEQRLLPVGRRTFPYNSLGGTTR